MLRAALFADDRPDFSGQEEHRGRDHAGCRRTAGKPSRVPASGRVLPRAGPRRHRRRAARTRSRGRRPRRPGRDVASSARSARRVALRPVPVHRRPRGRARGPHLDRRPRGGRAGPQPSGTVRACSQPDARRGAPHRLGQIPHIPPGGAGCSHQPRHGADRLVSGQRPPALPLWPGKRAGRLHRHLPTGAALDRPGRAGRRAARGIPPCLRCWATLRRGCLGGRPLPRGGGERRLPRPGPDRGGPHRGPGAEE